MYRENEQKQFHRT